MRYSKISLTIEQQIGRLEDRGLIFNNRSFASKALSNISYYRLRAYTYPFQDNKDDDHPFTQAVEFEDIYDLYHFDEQLKQIVFKGLGKIEIALRTQIIQNMSLKYGSHWYSDKSNFSDSRKFDSGLIAIIREINRSKEDFIEHYRDKYSTPQLPPSWMGLEVVSMGTLSKVYKNLLYSDSKQSIANHFGINKVQVLENWMLSFSSIRNICAHHARLWNRRFYSIIKLPYNTPRDLFSKQDVKQIRGYKLHARCNRTSK